MLGLSSSKGSFQVLLGRLCPRLRAAIERGSEGAAFGWVGKIDDQFG